MRVEYINPFLDATTSVLQEVLNAQVERGQVSLSTTSSPVAGVATFVGLAGDVEGRVLFDMSRETALNIASTMNMEKMTVIDDMVKSTITELANMITGSAVTKLQELGFKFDLTPPAIVLGSEMEFSTQNVEALIVPMKTPQGQIEVNIAVRQRF